MGEAKLRGAQPLSSNADRALVTKADMDSVKVWCDQVRSDVIELCDDAEVKYVQRCGELVALSEVALREEIQTVRAALDEYRRDDLLYRNNVSVRGRLRRFKWWLLAVLPFGIGACAVDGAAVGASAVRVTVDSARRVACYEYLPQSRSGVGLSCVRLDSLTVWRASDSTWILR